MRAKRQFPILLSLLLASPLVLSCASTIRPPGPADSRAAGLGIGLEMKRKLGPITTERNLPGVVLFVRLEEGEDLDDLTSKETLIPSTLVDGEHAYLLNVKPGTYVAVAAIYTEDNEPLNVPVASAQVSSNVSVGFSMDLFGGQTTYRNYFSREMITQTQTTVAPGTMAFMGHYVAIQSFRFGEAEDVQKHFLHVLEGADVDRTGFFDDLASSGFAHRLSASKVEKDSRATVKFCKQAKKHLKKTPWVPMIDRLKAAS